MSGEERLQERSELFWIHVNELRELLKVHNGWRLIEEDEIQRFRGFRE